MKKTIIALISAFFFSLNAFSAVNINTASQAQLESLSGIGPAKAKAIIKYRQKHGKFKSVNDLENVNGIGAATVKSLRKSISLTDKSSTK